MAEKKGIWLKALQETRGPYPGNLATRRFHRPDCPLGRQIAPLHRVDLLSKTEAYHLGFSPCRTCKP